jgi:D-alanine--poly(phosphoribitol) ligase subunit 2
VNSTETKVLGILERITGAPAIRENPDLDLAEEAILDSLGFVELIVALSEELAVPLSPAEINRADWATPRKIVANVEERLAHAR